MLTTKSVSFALPSRGLSPNPATSSLLPCLGCFLHKCLTPGHLQKKRAEKFQQVADKFHNKYRIDPFSASVNWGIGQGVLHASSQFEIRRRARRVSQRSKVTFSLLPPTARTIARRVTSPAKSRVITSGRTFAALAMPSGLVPFPQTQKKFLSGNRFFAGCFANLRKGRGQGSPVCVVARLGSVLLPKQSIPRKA
jgi:hypothetical protein